MSSQSSAPASATIPFSSGRAGRHAASAPDVPRQLPPAVPHFTGRADELKALAEILDEAVSDSSPGALVISAIGGTAGIGKTALALHWAHQVKDRFPDGQLHVNLRGFDPSGTPVAPADAIRRFLDALGVPAENIPLGAEAQAGLYLSLAAGSRMLIVLDNARDEEQVRPLLPASEGSLVLVTSRNQITGLAAAEGARLITLDTLTPDEAVRMLTARIGRRRAETDPAAVTEIAGLCAYLPLALSVVAARVNARPRFSLSSLASELRDAPERLAALRAGGSGASVETVFSWSYDQLSPEAARMFRLLGLHPGPDISLTAAASLTGTDEATALSQLTELDAGCLISEQAPGRYTFHDLLRAYAARQAETADGPAGTGAALERVLNYYARTARAAAMLLYPSREMMTFTGIDDPKDSTLNKNMFSSVRQARAWLAAEHASLMASVSLAAKSGFDRHAWQIPWFLATHLARSGYRDERIPLHRTALDAAVRAEDSAGQAVSSRLLGSAYLDLLRNLDQALDCYRNSADLYRRLGNRLGEAKAWQGLGTIAIGVQGRFADGVVCFEHELRLHQEIGHKTGEARALIALGMARVALSHISEGFELTRRALALATATGNQYLTERSWHNIAWYEQILGNFDEAVTAFRHTLDLAQESCDRFHEADVFAHLGDLYHAHGNPGKAREAWSQSLAIFNELEHPDADQVHAKLVNPGPPGSRLVSDTPLPRTTADAGEASHASWCSTLPLPWYARKPTDDTVQLRRPGV